MTQILIGLENPADKNDKITLEYEFVSNPLTDKWLDEYKLFITRDDAILEQRFGGFSKHNRQLPELINELNRNIEYVNETKKYPHMDTVNEKDWKTETHNVVHQHFANLIGQTHEYTDIVKGSDPAFWKAVGDINLLSHEIETLLSPDPIGAIHTSFLNSKKQYVMAHPFEDSDYNYFTLDWSWGDMVLHYCQLGKVWHEVFLDQDEVIPDSNINPLSHYDGSFDVLFWDPLSKEKKEKFFCWLKEERSIDPDDKKAGLGYVVCGQFIPPSQFQKLDRQGQIDFLGNYLKIESLSLLENGEKITKIISE